MDRSIVNVIRVACAASIVTAGCGGATPAKPPSRSVEGGPLLGIVSEYQPSGVYETFLTRLDGATLRPVGARAEVPELHATWRFSPDGRQVAVGTGGQGLGIHVYDVARMRLTRAIRTGIAAEALAWLTPGRLVALLQSGDIVVTDPRSGRVLRREKLRPGEGACFAEARASAVTPDGLVVLLAARRGRRARLLVVDAHGDVRALSLPADGTWGCDRAGFAVDPAGERAFVLSLEGTIAAVDLAAMRTTSHGLGGDPLRRATFRRLHWLGEGTLVASGLAPGRRPAGVSLVATADWANRTIDGGARQVAVAGGRILAYDGPEVALGGRARGLAAYDAAGKREFRVLDRRQIDFLHLVPGRAFAQTQNTLRAVDLDSGDVGRAHRGRRGVTTEIVVLARAGA